MRKTIGKKGLQKEFYENPEFANKLYKWMLNNSDHSTITFESFVRSGNTSPAIIYKNIFAALVEKLVNDPIEKDPKDSTVHILECIETTGVISLEKFTSQREDTSKMTLTYSQGLRLVKVSCIIF